MFRRLLEQRAVLAMLLATGVGVLGVHTQDFTSGDFSMSAPQTLALGDGGRFGGRLRATISGNLFAILRSPALRLVAFPGEHTPGILALCHLDPV